VQVLAQQLVAYCNGTADSAHSAHKLAPPEQHHPAMITVTALVDKKPSKFTLLLAERSPFGVLDAAKVRGVVDVHGPVPLVVHSIRICNAEAGCVSCFDRLLT